MRTIKFRIFVKEAGSRYKQGMHDDWEFISQDNFDMEFNPNKTLFNLALKYPEKFELMQYTGLKDKSGKEIYEGDIVQTKQGNRAVVEWRNDIDTDRYWWIATGFSIFIEDEQADFEHPLEVIGNIYENADLLHD